MTTSNTKLFDLERIEAIKVVFKAPIFEEDFPDRGMTASPFGGRMITHQMKKLCH